MKRGPGRHSPSGTRNPPGSKVTRVALEHRGLEWHGEIFHGGGLTAASDKKAGRPKGWAACTLFE